MEWLQLSPGRRPGPRGADGKREPALSCRLHGPDEPPGWAHLLHSVDRRPQTCSEPCVASYLAHRLNYHEE